MALSHLKAELDLERYAKLRAAIKEAARLYGFVVMQIETDEDRETEDVRILVTLHQSSPPTEINE